MKKGLRWLLGDGKSINIGSDKWLRAKPDFCVDNLTTSNQAKCLKVCDFFKENRKEWDVDKVNLHFSNEDVATIVNTRIPQGGTRDRIAWIYSSNGQYTVKSAYFQWCKSQTISEVNTTSGGVEKTLVFASPTQG